MGSPLFLHAANVYYVTAHFPITMAFLVWLYTCRPRPHYFWARNLLIAVTASALLIHILFPLAPPRMFPEWGIVDAMRVYGPNAYGGPSAAVSNQLAAMPSLHVGWAVLIVYVMARRGPRWLALLAGFHACTTLLVVIVTGNHWWLDAAVACILVALAAILLPPPESSSPGGTPRQPRKPRQVSRQREHVRSSQRLREGTYSGSTESPGTVPT